MNVEFPQKLRCLFEPKRYKVFHGGRGGAKSWGCARALLILGASKPLRILCARETQKSIKDSVHQLLKDQIIALGLESFYTVTNTEIRGKNGTQFGFEGLRHNISNLKSWEGADICWVEEAHTVTRSSWNILIPTIRKEGSEIWITFNPELEEDETYQRFVVDPPKDSFVCKITYKDNPWFPQVLELERLALKEKDPIAYDNVWEGNPKAAVEGAIFADHLRRATEEGRITDDVEYNHNILVHTYWDLGKRNKTAIWFAQYVGMQWRLLHCYSDTGRDLEHYCEYVKALPYNFGTHYLPHDARQDRMGMQRSIEDQVRAILGSVEVVERTANKANSIEAAKAIFPLCWFHKTNCADGLSDMRRYAFKVDPDTGRTSKEPDHLFSDVADAFQCFAMAAQPDLLEDDRPVFRVPTPRLG